MRVSGEGPPVRKFGEGPPWAASGVETGERMAKTLKTSFRPQLSERDGVDARCNEDLLQVREVGRREGLVAPQIQDEVMVLEGRKNARALRAPSPLARRFELFDADMPATRRTADDVRETGAQGVVGGCMPPILEPRSAPKQD